MDSKTALNFLCIFVFLILIAFYRAYHQLIINIARNRRLANIDGVNEGTVIHETERNAGIDANLIAELPSFIYSQKDEYSSTKECSVCLVVFVEGEIVRMLTVCKHVFHMECIDKWLVLHSTCPICRAVVEPLKVGSKVHDCLCDKKEKASTSIASGSSSPRFIGEWSGRLDAHGHEMPDLEKQ